MIQKEQEEAARDEQPMAQAARETELRSLQRQVEILKEELAQRDAWIARAKKIIEHVAYLKTHT